MSFLGSALWNSKHIHLNSKSTSLELVVGLGKTIISCSQKFGDMASALEELGNFNKLRVEELFRILYSKRYTANAGVQSW